MKGYLKRGFLGFRVKGDETKFKESIGIYGVQGLGFRL